MWGRVWVECGQGLDADGALSVLAEGMVVLIVEQPSCNPASLQQPVARGIINDVPALQTGGRCAALGKASSWRHGSEDTREYWDEARRGG